MQARNTEDTDVRKLGLVAIALLGSSQTHAADELSEAMAKASAGTLAPLQMPDGSKLWRFAGKLPKGEDVEMRVIDLIAQALARSNWCPNGWEETKRYPATMGVSVIEGRCR